MRTEILKCGVLGTNSLIGALSTFLLENEDFFRDSEKKMLVLEYVYNAFDTEGLMEEMNRFKKHADQLGEDKHLRIVLHIQDPTSVEYNNYHALLLGGDEILIVGTGQGFNTDALERIFESPKSANMEEIVYQLPKFDGLMDTFYEKPAKPDVKFTPSRSSRIKKKKRK